MNNSFNLIDEPWIPIADHGLASLRDIFTNKSFTNLGGNPVQKIAVFKLLLAIAQAASTPKDESEWQALGSAGLAEKCLAYLEKWHDRFYLYGNKPFLQMPAIAGAEIKTFGVVLPEISTGNTTVLLQTQNEPEFSNADKALILLVQMGFALSGKKTDNSLVLTPGYAGKQNDKGKASSGKTGPSVGHMGFLHNFVFGSNLLESIYLNTFSLSYLTQLNLFIKGVGVPPWEEMPAGEACPTAENLKQSYIGRLIPMCRFCLLTEKGLHYSEGLAHLNYKEGVFDLSLAINFSSKEPKVLWTNTEKRPWRELTSLLSFIISTESSGFQSHQLVNGINLAKLNNTNFRVWSGGLRVSSNAGEQYASGSDDYVESQILLAPELIGKNWFTQLKQEMQDLENLAKTLYGRVLAYFKDLTTEGAQAAAQATNLFWQLCERNFQDLVDNCDATEEESKKRQKLRKTFAAYQHQAFDTYCPNQTARQIDAWARNRPNHTKYINQEA